MSVSSGLCWGFQGIIDSGAPSQHHFRTKVAKGRPNQFGRTQFVWALPTAISLFVHWMQKFTAISSIGCRSSLLCSNKSKLLSTPLRCFGRRPPQIRLVEGCGAFPESAGTEKNTDPQCICMYHIPRSSFRARTLLPQMRLITYLSCFNDPSVPEGTSSTWGPGASLSIPNKRIIYIYIQQFWASPRWTLRILCWLSLQHDWRDPMPAILRDCHTERHHYVIYYITYYLLRNLLYNYKYM